MKPNSAVTRSTVTEELYAVPEFSKSGFSMPYSRHTSFMLGRLHISGVHWTMPSDKIYGNNSGDLTFNRIVTPMLTPVDAGQYNFYLPLRAIDNTFEDAMAPSELNEMSAGWHTPKVNTRSLLSALFAQYDIDSSIIVRESVSMRQSILNNPAVTIEQWRQQHYSDVPLVDLIQQDIYVDLIDMAINSLTNPYGGLYQQAKVMYLTDALKDIADNIKNKLGSSTNNTISGSTPLASFYYTILDCLISPWLGRYSYYGELRYNYIRPFDLYRFVYSLGILPAVPFFTAFDNTPLCEYPLRVMYAIWYERFRDVHVEKVSPTLPHYKKFGSTSIFDLNAGGNLCYLIYRIRAWYDDPFTAAQVDDISRHVYAPVNAPTADSVAYRIEANNNLDANPSAGEGFSGGSITKPAVYELGYRDMINGENRRVSCPVPSNINDYLANLDTSFQAVFGLDLNTLRQSQMLERYLKRNYVFGDEYPDRMLAHYNSRVSDMRINKPELIGQSLNQSVMSQEISNVSTELTKVGDRTATATVQFSGDDYSVFCEEFGIIINLLSLMPHAIYDGIDPHLLLDKESDFPKPEFAANNEEFGRKMEIAASGLAPYALEDDNTFIFGRYPAYHIWRGRVDEVGGMFLDELQDCTFRRFWGLYSPETMPKLNYEFLHCRPNLGMFENTNRYDSQVYGTVNHEFFCERVLPTPIEVI